MAHPYGHPDWWEVLWQNSSDADAEFLNQCFAKHAERIVQRVYDPACGSGRLLWRLMQKGYKVVGTDVNNISVQYARRKVRAKKMVPRIVRHNMSDFIPQELGSRYDACYLMVNDFCELKSYEVGPFLMARIAELNQGGLLILGLHVVPEGHKNGAKCWKGWEEEWSGEDDRLRVNSCLRYARSVGRTDYWDLILEAEYKKPTRDFDRATCSLSYLCYSYRELVRLVTKEGPFRDFMELVAVYDFNYDFLDRVLVDDIGDGIFVFRKK